MEPILTVSMIQQFRKNFKSSLIFELYWENKIDYDFLENEQSFQKLSLTSLFRKFFSKKIRSFFN